MKKNLELKAFNYDCSDVFNNDHRISIAHILLDIECKFCKALKFQDESDNMCCGKGKINLPNLTTPEEPLSTYLSGTTIESKHFLSNIRKYNYSIYYILIYQLENYCTNSKQNISQKI
uniref:Uncharacterized protein n=1 Tax=Schizaphis graminum TaxID=13262 RepID=A0A2S2P8B2_SCHGA